MPLQVPNLDDRDFMTLVSEARNRIPRYLPEWTDWNDSDPGITLLQLHAWLTETILYRLNRLPDLNYIKFLQLLGVECRPARPAQANLTFLLKEKTDGAEILIPKGTVVNVAARDLPQPLAFETDQSLVAISARLTQLLMLGADTGAVTDVTQANLVSGQSFAPFGASAQPGAALLLGFSSELPLSREEIGLQIHLAEAGRALLARPLVARCGSTTADAEAPQLAWEWWDGLRWSPLDVTADETECLTSSGHIYFKVPGQIPAVALHSLGSGAAPIPLELTDVAGITSDQAATLHKAGTTTADDLAKLTPAALSAILKDQVPSAMKEEALRYVETQLRRAGLGAVDSLIGLTTQEQKQLLQLFISSEKFSTLVRDFKTDLTDALKKAPPGMGLTDEQVSDYAERIVGQLPNALKAKLTEPLREALLAIIGALRAPPAKGLTEDQINALVDKTTADANAKPPTDFFGTLTDSGKTDLIETLRRVLERLSKPPGQDLTSEQIENLVGPELQGLPAEQQEARHDFLVSFLISLRLVDLQIDALVDQTVEQVKALFATLSKGVGVLREVKIEDAKAKALINRLSPLQTDALIKIQSETIIAEARQLLSPELLYWLRVRLGSGTYASVPQIDQILTNTIQASAARTVLDEALGAGTGRPNQRLRLRYALVLAEPPLELEVDGETWTEVSDFYGSRPGDNHYLLNRTSGTIAFGDGMRGRMPPPSGGANIVARQYRWGGGQIGNVGSGTITGLSSPIMWVEQVTNYRAAVGGADEEALADTLRRAPHELKVRDRAVTLEDFEVLACATPGAQVARAVAYVAAGQPANTRLISVVIVPQSADAKPMKPMPSEATLRLVCRYLDERRLITTRVTVAGPAYHDIDVVLDVRAHPRADLKTVKSAIDSRLREYFHPLRDGPEGRGWPFGRDIYYSELLRELMMIDGVRRIESVTLRKFLLSQLLAEAPAPRAQLPQTNGTQATGLRAAAALAKRPSILPGIVAGGLLTEAEALKQQDALVQSEKATFPDSHPVGKIVPLVVPNSTGKLLPVPQFHVVAEYECADLPVAPGALVALREARISVSYDRTAGTP